MTTAAALAAFDLIPVVAVREVVDFGAAFDSHVVAAEIAAEEAELDACLKLAHDYDGCDFGDRCYYADRATEAQERLDALRARAAA